MAFETKRKISTGSSSSGVSSFNTLTGDITLAEGAGIDLTTAGNTITISAIGASVDNDNSVAVKVATTAVLPGTPTYNNGASGVGATLTRSSNGTTGTIDGITAANLMAGDRILVKNQAAQLQNGIYEVTQQGTVSLPYILTRTTDADATVELDDLVAIATLGTTNKGVPFGQQTNNPTVGTSNIVWTPTGIYLRQQTTGTQAADQIPVYTGTALTLTKGTSAFKYSPTTNIFTINGIAYLFPSDNGDANEVLVSDGAGNLTWSSGIAIGNEVIGGTPDSILYIDNAGDLTEDVQFTRDHTTLETMVERDFNSVVLTYEIEATEVMIVSGVVGTFQVGETITGGTSGATGVVDYVGLDDFIIYSSPVGTFTPVETITGGTSGATGTISQLITNTFSVGNTFVVIDIDNTTFLGQGEILAIVAGGYSITMNSGTIVAGNAISIGNAPIAAGILSVTPTAPIITPLVSGMYSQDLIGGFAGGTAFQQSSSQGTATVGVIDASSFGGSTVTAGMLANDGAGTSAQFYVSPNATAMLTDNPAGDNSIMLMQAGVFSLGTSLAGGSSYGFQAEGDKVAWIADDKTFYLPDSTPSLGEVLTVGNISGQEITLIFDTPAAGAPAGPNGAIQYNNSGVFGGVAGFEYDDVTNILTAEFSNGLYLRPAQNQQQLGSFQAAGGGNYIRFINDTASEFDYIGNVSTTSSITFTGVGLNDVTTNSGSYYGVGSHTWTMTLLDNEVQRFQITGVTGTFNGGNTVAGVTSGATGTILAILGGFYYIEVDVPGTPFLEAETINNTSVAGSGTVSGASPVLDFFDWTDGTTSGYGLTGGSTSLTYGMIVNFPTNTGYTITDEWSFSVSSVSRRKLAIINGVGTQNSIIIGSGNETGVGAYIQMYDTEGTINTYFEDFYRITDFPTNNDWLKIDTASEFISLGVVNSTSIVIDDSANSQVTVESQKMFNYRNADGLWFQVDTTVGQERVRFGDLASAANLSSFILDDFNQRFAVGLGGIGSEVEIDLANATARFGGINTNQSYLDIDDATRTLKIGSIQNQGTEIEMDSDDGVITYTGAKAETSIRTLAYNSNHGLNIDDYILKFSGSTGAASVILDSVAFRTGQILIIKDYDCIAATSNITLDAGTGNIISANSQAQTFVMNTNGQCIYIRHMGGGDWQIE